MVVGTLTEEIVTVAVMMVMCAYEPASREAMTTIDTNRRRRFLCFG